ncbi:unnamed protein product [Rhodiola kirilowii]
MTNNKQKLHIAMFPWFAMGHITSYMHLSNKLAHQGHKISFLLPSKPHKFISTLNHHPNLITLINVPLRTIPGLHPNTQTTADCTNFSTHHLLATAFDKTAPFIESSLHTLKPDFIFYDFAYWVPRIANRFGLLAVCFFTVSSASVAHLLIPDEECDLSDQSVPADFPHPCVALRKYEAKMRSSFATEDQYGEGVSLKGRLIKAVKNSNAIVFKTCRELEGHYLDYVEKHSKKAVLTAGPTIPAQPSTPLNEHISAWLSTFKPKSVIYCAFGSENVLPLTQFQELVLGIELTGLPFLVALKRPAEVDHSIDLALPDGFKRRTKDRGMVTEEWVQQLQILGHESVGCFVTHCGSGSVMEGLISECQLVLCPRVAEQSINARVMGRDLRVGVEVELREEDGLFDRYGVCEAVKQAMDLEDGGIGKEVMINHDKWRKLLLTPGLETSCVEDLVNKLKHLINK